MVDYIQALLKKIKKRKSGAVIVAFIAAIVFIGNFLGSINTISQFFFPSQPIKISDQQLKKETIELAQNISSFAGERKIGEPSIDHNNWDASVRNLLQYDQESLTLYYVGFGASLASIREQFSLRNINDTEFNEYYMLPTNYLGMQLVSSRLDAMAAMLPP